MSEVISRELTSSVYRFLYKCNPFCIEILKHRFSSQHPRIVLRPNVGTTNTSLRLQLGRVVLERNTAITLAVIHVRTQTNHIRSDTLNKCGLLNSGYRWRTQNFSFWGGGGLRPYIYIYIRVYMCVCVCIIHCCVLMVIFKTLLNKVKQNVLLWQYVSVLLDHL